MYVYARLTYNGNVLIPPDWPYCNAARQLSSVIMSTKDFSQWDQLKYRRRIETFGIDDGPGNTAPLLSENYADCFQ